MYGYDWMFFAMQLASNGIQVEETLEIEPVLQQSTTTDDFEVLQSPSEISLVSEDDDPQGLDADEHTNLVNADLPQCRICLDTEGDDLISPCHCKGTQKYVHRSCLDNWRSTKEGFAFAHCTECRAVFILRANVPPDRWWLRLKFQFLVVRDHALIFIIVQLVVAFLGMLVYRFYGEELREMFGYEQHPYGFYSMARICGGK
ncbi:Zinc finger RING/FYVE/PHD-type protein [Dioscorea alata]|uniref:Zinc finger RING/FYVE/PHD-type protein n=1 Tax=Dioscorea alata TaxID=55571 RepID=A0ACB7VKP7_DIOAL|nr:Zinc finger RING/FYVE/PHD-type protein [Dioscorea alata]